MQNIPWQFYCHVVVYIDYTIVFIIQIHGGRTIIQKLYQRGKQRPTFQDFYQREYEILFNHSLYNESTVKQVRLLKSYKMDVKNIKIQQFSIPAKKRQVLHFHFHPKQKKNLRQQYKIPKHKKCLCDIRESLFFYNANNVQWDK